MMWYFESFLGYNESIDNANPYESENTQAYIGFSSRGRLGLNKSVSLRTVQRPTVDKPSRIPTSSSSRFARLVWLSHFVIQFLAIVNDSAESVRGASALLPGTIDAGIMLLMWRFSEKGGTVNYHQLVLYSALLTWMDRPLGLKVQCDCTVVKVHSAYSNAICHFWTSQTRVGGDTILYLTRFYLTRIRK